MKKMKKITALLLVAVFCVSTLAGCDDGRTKKVDALNEDDAKKTLEALLTKVDKYDLPLEYDLSGLEQPSGLAAELPDIETYDMPVRGTGEVNIEIFGSTEKATKSDTDGWLLDVAEDFNSQGLKVNGKTVSVSIRTIASGAALDYIISGKYIPDAYTPSNELWGMMAEAEGVSIELAEKYTVGNTAGILMSEKRYDEFVEKYSTVTLGNVVEEALNGNILLGYTNPYVSSTGLNILTSMLQSFDTENPLSETATAKLEKLQENIPPVSYTTAQMRETAAKGLLDAMIMEYQAYINTPELKKYKFVPFGVRHDNPVYAMESCTGDKKEALKLFTEFCKSDESQKKAEKVGFNANADYQSADLNYTGADLYAAQEIWKKKKDAGQPVVAVFVTDTSGSMEGTPITELKTSLLNASQYIGESNYIGLVSYNDDVYVNLPISQFNNNQRAAFTGAIKNLSAMGGTATYDAILVAEQMLLEAKADIPNAKTMIFVLSDGEQTSGYEIDKVTPVLAGLKVPIHTICYGTMIEEMETISNLNEASMIQAQPEDVVYNLKNVFNAQM